MMKYILKNYYKYLIFIVIFSSICAFLTLLLPDIFADIITRGIGNQNTAVIYQNGIKLILISTLVLVSSILASFFSNRLGAKIGFNLRKKLYEKTLSLDEENLRLFGIPTLIVRNTNDINQIQTMVSIFFKTISYTFVLSIGAIIKAFKRSSTIPYLTTIIIICIIIVIIVLFIIFITVIPRYNKLQILLDKINNRFQEVLKGILIIRVFNQQNFEINKTKKITDEHTNLEYFLNKIMSLLNPFVTLILDLCAILIVIVIFNYAFDIESIANMLAFSEYANRVISSFLSLAICFILFPKAFVSYKRVEEINKTFNKIYDYPNAKTIDKIRKIEFQNVYFTYPESTKPCLENISFQINKGDTIAIIGATGSGKSTIINLLNRFYDVTEGSIKINDIDIRKIKMSDINKKVATVFQQEFLFNANIKENLFTNDNNKAQKALEQSALRSMKSDLEKNISFNGNNLSGGQKQRLAIARALLKKAEVLILDDALSAVDYQTERIIMNNINNEYSELIRIIITNRLSSIKNVDRIIVLDNGKIVGQGNHKTLIKNCSLYKKMVASQSEVNSRE